MRSFQKRGHSFLSRRRHRDLQAILRAWLLLLAPSTGDAKTGFLTAAVTQWGNEIASFRDSDSDRAYESSSIPPTHSLPISPPRLHHFRWQLEQASFTELYTAPTWYQGVQVVLIFGHGPSSVRHALEPFLEKWKTPTPDCWVSESQYRSCVIRTFGSEDRGWSSMFCTSIGEASQVSKQ